MIGLLQQTAPAATGANSSSALGAATTVTTTVPVTTTTTTTAATGAAAAPAGATVTTTVAAPAGAAATTTTTVAPDAAHAAAGHGTAAVTTTTTHDAEAATTTHATTEAVPAVGMPQLDTTTFANQIFWLALTLVLIWWVLSRIALPRIGSVLADRQNAIGGDLGAAEEFKRKARDAEAAYDRALAEARAEAQGIAGQQKAAMQEQIDAAIARADADIGARTAQSEERIAAIHSASVSDARSVARDVTAELVQSLGGRPDPEAIAAAVDRRLERAVQ